MMTASAHSHETADSRVDEDMFDEDVLDERPIYTSTLSVQDQLERVQSCLEDNKAEDIVTIDLAGKSSIADYMVIASGRSSRHAVAIADHLSQKLKTPGAASPPIEGLPQADWVLIDAGDVIVHVFRPEVRVFYNLERMWTLSDPSVACINDTDDLGATFSGTDGWTDIPDTDASDMGSDSGDRL